MKVFKRVLKTVAIIFYFIIFCYVFTSSVYTLYFWIKNWGEYSFYLHFKAFFISIWKLIPQLYEHNMLFVWFRDYGMVFTLSFIFALVLLLIIQRKWVIKQAKRFVAWIKHKKQNSKSNRIKRLEDEVNQLKKGE